MRHNLARGKLSALAITASGYTSGEHLTFYQSDRPIDPWHRFLRRAVPSAIGIDHIMASSAIPFVFRRGRCACTGRSNGAATGRCGSWRPSARPSTWGPPGCW